MVDLATKSIIVNEYIDRLAAALLQVQVESGISGEQLRVLRRDQAQLWTETRSKVVRALDAERCNGTLDAAVEAGTLIIDGVSIPALP